MPILGLHINLAQLEDEATTNLGQAGLFQPVEGVRLLNGRRQSGLKTL